MMHHERVLAAMQTQADTVARLERERNQAWEEFRALSVRAGADVERLERELAEARYTLKAVTDSADAFLKNIGERRKEIEALKADAEALRALAAWVNADKGWRKVSGICSGELFAFEVTIQFWRGTDGEQQVWGEADTLAAAIMDAMGQVGK